MKRTGLFLRKIWLPGVYGRLAFLLFTLSLLTLYFYVIGNFQGFSDATMVLLLRMESWILVAGTLVSIVSTVVYACTFWYRRYYAVVRIIISVLMMACCFVLYFLVALLQAFMLSYPEM